MIKFSGIVQSRSSVTPPGDADVLAMNPARRDRILRATGWKDVFPGTLNLKVTADTVHRLLLCTPVIRESAEDIVYPPEFAHIPRLRVGYLYFRGRIRKHDDVLPVLIRRACNPLPELLEAMSEFKLRDTLGLSDGESVLCEIDA